MKSTITIDGLDIVTRKIAYIGRIETKKGDSYPNAVAFGLMPGQKIFALDIHLTGDENPLTLTAGSKSEIVRARIIDTLHQFETMKGRHNGTPKTPHHRQS